MLSLILKLDNMEFYSIFYRLNLYGQDLFYHLGGWDSNIQDFVQDKNQLPLLWLVALGTALCVFVFYYFILNHPKINRLWHWFIALAIPVLFVFLYSRGVVMADINGTSTHPIDPTLNIASNNATMFGLYNGVLSGMFFFLLSIVFRFGSKNCKNTPFKSIINRK